jgi:hypothetical protein
MIKHKPKTKEAVTIGHETYTPDKDGFIYLPYKYKKYNPVKEKKKSTKKVD